MNEKNTLFTIFCILFEVQDMLLYRIDEISGQTLKQNLKRQYNQIRRDAAILKTRLAKFEEDFLNIVKCDNYSELVNDANYIMRILMLVADRCRNAETEQQLEDFLKNMQSVGLFSNDFIDSFKIK